MPKIIYYRPPLKPYQKAAFFHDKRYAWIEGTTKCGKTYTGIAWLLEEALKGKPKNYWWVAPSYKQADIAFVRMGRALGPVHRETNKSARTIRLPNGNTIWFLSGEDPDNLYGEDVGAAVLDEDTRMREEAYIAVRSTTTFTKGKIRGIGNIRGTKNWAYKKAREAQAALNDPNSDSHWAAITSKDAVDHGILSQDEIEDARKHLPESAFNELYLGIPSQDGSNPFGYDHIANCVSPLSLKPARVFGVDLARGKRPGGDWTVVIGLDEAGHVCKFERWQMPWTETKARIKGIVGRTKCLVDSSGVGDGIVEDLQRDGGSNYEGYTFTLQSKQKLMEGLVVAIQQGMTHFPDGPIRNELDSFEFEYLGKDGRETGVRYSAASGMHDDCVCALALAVNMMPKSLTVWDNI